MLLHAPIGDILHEISFGTGIRLFDFFALNGEPVRHNLNKVVEKVIKLQSSTTESNPGWKKLGMNCCFFFRYK